MRLANEARDRAQEPGRAHHDPRGERRSVLELDAAHATIAHQHAAHGRARPHGGAELPGQAAEDLGDPRRAALGITLPAGAGEPAQGEQRLARRCLGSRQQQRQAKQPAEPSGGRGARDEAGHVRLGRHVVARRHIDVAHRPRVREETRGARGLQRREVEAAREIQGGPGEPEEIRLQDDAASARCPGAGAREAERRRLVVLTEGDRVALAHAAEHVAERTLLAAAEHVRGCVDTEAVPLASGRGPAQAALLLDEQGRDTGVRKEERRGSTADARADHHCAQGSPVHDVTRT